MRHHLCVVLTISGLVFVGFVYYYFSISQISGMTGCNPSMDNEFKRQDVITDFFFPVGDKEVKRQDDKTDLLFPVGIKYNQPSTSNNRPDVPITTTWLAPIVWEGTFDSSVLDAIYLRQNISVAATVFALGKYVGFLKDFLETAEKHFMVGYRVHYYLFTDRPDEVPNVQLGPGRELTKISTASSNRWQEITLRRMERIEKLIEEQLLNKVDYIFSLDVDTKFYGHWGAETLADIIAVLHPGYFGASRKEFPYERRPESLASIPWDEGDYYYGGAVLGGRPERVLKVTKTCRTNLDLDRLKNIEAAWQEESHLNRYFLYNKPLKVLSPEYLWQDFKAKTSNMKVIRFSQVIKNYAAVRPNP